MTDYKSKIDTLLLSQKYRTGNLEIKVASFIKSSAKLATVLGQLDISLTNP